MPNDFITFKALSQELDNTLASGKIDKIFMPEKDEIALAIRANGANHLLTISCNPSHPRIHLSTRKKENPFVAPPFCMHLRKYLSGGIIDKISLLNNDRIFCIQITSNNELRDKVQFCLVAEIMGRYSNILLKNSNNIITDVLKQVPFDMVTKRCVLPSAKYEYPEQNKISLDDTPKISLILQQFDSNNNSLAQYLTTHLAGLSIQTATEIVHKSNITPPNLSDIDINNIINNIQLMLETYDNNFKPCYTTKDGIAQDFFVYNYHNLDSYIYTDTLNQAIEHCNFKKDENLRQKDKTKELTKAYNTLLSRTQKKLEKSQTKLVECNNMDKYKLYGDILSANLTKITKGDKSAILDNYYDNTTITIPLNIQLSPQQNLKAFYTKYAKLKRTQDIVAQQIEELSYQIEYLKTIQQSLKLCSTDDEITEIYEELSNAGATFKQKKPSKQKAKNGQPFTYLVDDFVICVGKNNIQNDKLTFKVANGNDMWIHTQKTHGSHTIIFVEGRDVPDNVLLVACEICAYYSQGKNSPKVECDYTRRKNVKRHPIGKLGMVTYSSFNSMLVTPNQHLKYLEK